MALSSQTRSATVPCFAKLNLSLKVLYRRADNFHELRTLFQSVSLADTLAIDYRPGRGREVELGSSIAIPDNLVARAAGAVMDAASIKGAARFALTKRIPMGAGMGGGSSDAAAVLLALPVLAGKPLPMSELTALAASLGADVPFFLHGGAALGVGRGDELFPMPDPQGARHALLVLPNLHISTALAFGGLGRPSLTELTLPEQANRMGRFQSLAWSLACAESAGRGWEAFCENDFEAAVFPQFPLLKSLHRKLNRSGATLARMTGSGSALFGLFPSREACEQGVLRMGTLPSGVSVQIIRLSTRAQYRASWRRALGPHLTEAAAWPPK